MMVCAVPQCEFTVNFLRAGERLLTSTPVGFLWRDVSVRGNLGGGLGGGTRSIGVQTNWVVRSGASEGEGVCRGGRGQRVRRDGVTRPS